MKTVLVLDNNVLDDPITMTILERSVNKEIIIAFSGTKKYQELVDEIVKGLPVDYDLHPSDGSRVLGFFYRRYLDDFRVQLLLKLKDMVNSWYDSGYSVVFTGHSLGGAIAIHAAADALLEGIISKQKVYIYTFGQPRVGNDAFMNQFIHEADEYYRLVHYNELVPHVPPCIPDLSGGCIKTGFFPIFPYHAPTEVWYTEDMSSFTVCSSIEGEDRSCSNQVTSDSIDNHIHYFGIEVGEYYNSNSFELKTDVFSSEFLKISV
jgi:hypothetical protein